MGAGSKIQWTTHTFNPWIGCAKVSPGCKSCYAEADMDHRRHMAKWGDGPDSSRHVTSDANWRKPIAWNKAAEAAGERHRVFCASLADVFEDRSDILGARWRLFKLIEDTPGLDWLLLTKRPENVVRQLRLYARFLDGFTNLNDRDKGLRWVLDWLEGKPPENVWIGTSVEDQERADERIPILLQVPVRVRFLSVEPMLGPIDLTQVRWRLPDSVGVVLGSVLGHSDGRLFSPRGAAGRGIDWVIVGGESGSKARPFDLAWARSLRDQCEAAGVAYFLKQLGSCPVETPVPGYTTGISKLNHSHGGDESEWPSDLKGCRAFPVLVTA